MLAFVLCNGLRRRELANDDSVYEGSSPDEICLAKSARHAGFVAETKSQKQVSVRGPKGTHSGYSSLVWADSRTRPNSQAA